MIQNPGRLKLSYDASKAKIFKKDRMATTPFIPLQPPHHASYQTSSKHVYKSYNHPNSSRYRPRDAVRWYYFDRCNPTCYSPLIRPLDTLSSNSNHSQPSLSRPEPRAPWARISMSVSPSFSVLVRIACDGAVRLRPRPS
ncbi:hypothetical protein E2P81_ATG03179 [Venturia nashicola]|nr:hypothetical protein E2P81_ATG03179 [Venturia nashicola]